MSNPSKEESRAIIIQWHGKALGLDNQKNLIEAMVEAGIITVDRPVIIEFNSDDLAKAAYLKAVLGANEDVVLPRDIDPILTSIVVIGKRYGKMDSNSFTIHIMRDVMSEVHKKSIGLLPDTELISALEILATKTITAKYAPELKKLGISKAMLEVIRNVYNSYYVTEQNFFMG